jgi:ketopantoate hydroxymethyltransferase
VFPQNTFNSALGNKPLAGMTRAATVNFVISHCNCFHRTVNTGLAEGVETGEDKMIQVVTHIGLLPQGNLERPLDKSTLFKA